jgi:signal transduction histidine kinase
VRVGVAGGEVEIVVDDTGPGIPPAQLEAVMRPFFRLESSRSRLTGGSGLGLYIARDLVTREGGTLTLANRPEGGLRARIALPRA